MRGGSCEGMLSSTCVQSSVAGRLRLGGGYEATQFIEARSPAPASAWHAGQMQVKQEPMEHDSSAYGSGSDGFHSSSPAGSDHSRDSNLVHYTSAHLNNNNPMPSYYSTPITNRVPVTTMSYQPMNNTFNPLTPPSFEPTSPKDQETFQENSNATLTPCTTPPSEITPPKSPKNTPEDTENEEHYYGGKEGDDHLRRLQMAFERNGMLPSPKGSENRDSNDEDDDMDELDEQGHRVPRVNSHGKIKTFKCKQCGFVAVTKLDFWEHSRAHIKADKLLTCPKCPFVTEYKHHLEYHLRNHFGSKPFKCDKCSYSCVNKSMLNSHLKSHSNVYQYRCADCTYATKYCHSLKLHLRKYKHSPAMVLNPDGTPNPLPIIDVYGTRRGPKQKSLRENEMSPSQVSPNNLPNLPSLSQHSIFPQFMLPTTQSSGMSLPFPYGPLLGAFGSPLLFPPMAQGQISPSPSNGRSTPESLRNEEESPKQIEVEVNIEEPEDKPPKDEASNPLDLSKPEITLPITVPVPVNTPIMNPAKNRRKGRAFKLERITKDVSSDEEILEDKPEKMEVIPDVKPAQEVKTNEVNKKLDIFNCQYCDIAFRDVVMYTMHMGYHGYKDPFTCNMCGEQSVDKVSFFLHIARTSHS